VQLDSTGLAPSSYIVSSRLDAGHGGAAGCVAGLSVIQPPAKPQALKFGECGFQKMISTRLDNVCGRTLADVTLRLQNDPKSNVVLVGYADPKHEANGKVAESHAENAKK